MILRRARPALRVRVSLPPAEGAGDTARAGEASDGPGARTEAHPDAREAANCPQETRPRLREEREEREAAPASTEAPGLAHICRPCGRRWAARPKKKKAAAALRPGRRRRGLLTDGDGARHNARQDKRHRERESKNR